MTKLFLSHAHSDNPRVVDVAQHLRAAGLTVRLDLWDLAAGLPLWEQIEAIIASPEESDAWAVFATEASLTSPAVREELAYALDRALDRRGRRFPLIGIFPKMPSDNLISKAIKTRLYVSTADPDWIQRVVAGARGEPLGPPPLAEPEIFYIGVKGPHVEVKPTLGEWVAPFVAVPLAEAEQVDPDFFFAPGGIVQQTNALSGAGPYESRDGLWWVVPHSGVASFGMSMMLEFRKAPSRFKFGSIGGPTFEVPDARAFLFNNGWLGPR